MKRTLLIAINLVLFSLPLVLINQSLAEEKTGSSFNAVGGGLLAVNAAYSLSGKETPRELHYTNGVYGVYGAYQGGAAAVANGTKCTPAPATWGFCLMAVAEGAGSLASLYTSYTSFDNADAHDTSGSIPRPTAVTSPDNFTVPQGAPVGGSPSGLPTTVKLPDFPVSTSVLKGKASEIEATVNTLFNDLRAKGIPVDDLLQNPEKHLSKEDIEKVKSEVAQNQDQPKKSTEEMLDEMMKDDTSGSENSDFNFSNDFRSIAFEGGIMIDDFSGMDLPDFDKLFSQMFQQGIENSAPGYYGNIPLNVLNPKSKQSLFERVSVKIQKLM